MIIITGGSGFIGSNLVGALSDRGEAPLIVCDRIDCAVRQGNLAKHDVSEVIAPADLPKWLMERAGEVDGIFHMGATSETTETDFAHLLDNNLGVSMMLWRWCVENDTAFIYASSAATYGDGKQGFDDDNDPAALAELRPLNAYGWSKQLFDQQVLSMSAAGYSPKKWAGLKFFNVYGPNEYHKGGQRSVAVQLFEQISTTGCAKLFQSHHPDYDDGGQMRDFVWVNDCVDIMLWLYSMNKVNGIYNCGTGEARSFRNLAEACFAAMGKKSCIDYIAAPLAIREKYQYFTEAKMSRLRGSGYNKPFTSIEDGVKQYIRNYLSTTDRYR